MADPTSSMEMEENDTNRPMHFHEPPSNPEPPRGILKRPSTDCTSAQGREQSREGGGKHVRAHWDEEMLQYINENKDYGFMKIDEPKTPYHALGSTSGAEQVHDVPEFSLDGSEDGDVDKICGRSTSQDANGDVRRGPVEWSDGEEDEHARTFRAKRKQHYNEFYNVQLARQLLAKEEDKEEEDGPGDD